MKIYILNHYAVKYHRLYSSNYFTTEEKAKAYMKDLIKKYGLFDESQDGFDIEEREVDPEIKED